MKKNQHPLLNSVNGAYYKPRDYELKELLKLFTGQMSVINEEFLSIKDEQLLRPAAQICEFAARRLEALREKETGLKTELQTSLGNEDGYHLRAYARYERQKTAVASEEQEIKQDALQDLKRIKKGILRPHELGPSAALLLAKPLPGESDPGQDRRPQSERTDAPRL